jgi:hypothetical protein
MIDSCPVSRKPIADRAVQRGDVGFGVGVGVGVGGSLSGVIAPRWPEEKPVPLDEGEPRREAVLRAVDLLGHDSPHLSANGA